MKMQDYRRAADRVHIAEHCRQEVLSMNKHTEPKSRTPITRMAAGIAAAAAVLTVTGGFGYLLLSMKDDVQRGPANTDSEIADQSAAYISYFRDYYELRAGHPVDFDFSTLCGTDFDMAWEMDGCTVTLNAAICDGYEIDYIYTIEPHYDFTPNDENFYALPQVQIQALDGTTSQEMAVRTDFTSCLDDELREDGTLRVFGSTAGGAGVIPLSDAWEFRVDCTSGVKEETSEGEVISVNIPDELPPYRELSGLLGVKRYDFDKQEDIDDELIYGIVTPLGITLTDYNPYELQTPFEELGDVKYSGVITAGTNIVTVQKNISEQDPQDVAVVYSSLGTVGAHATFEVETYEFSDGACDYISLALPFSEPLDLSDVDYLTFGSEQTDAVTLPVNGEAPTEDTPDADLITAETEEFPPFNILNAQWRTKEYGFGFVTAEGISYDENGNPVMNLTIIPNKSFTIEEGDTLELRMMPLGYDDNGYCYEIRNDEVMQGFKWTTGAQADENGEYHVQLTLDPLSKAYYRVQNEDGEYVSESGDADEAIYEAIYWETLDIALFLNELRVVHPDGTDRTFTGDGTEDDVFLKFRFGMAAYPAFAEIPEAARTRHIDFADVRLADATRDGNIVEMKFGVKLDDSVTVQEGDTVALVPFVASWDSNFEVIESNSMESEYTATAPDADGWYYFYDKVDISDLPETEQVLFNCSVHCLRIHRGNEGIVYDVTPHTAKEVEATLFCRFSLD